MGTRVLDTYIARALALSFTNTKLLIYSPCASVFLSTLAKPDPRLVTPAGNCTAWSMGYSLMARCHLTKLLEGEMIHSTPSLQRLGQASMYLGLYLLIQNQLSSTRFVQEPTGSSSIRNSYHRQGRCGKQLRQRTLHHWKRNCGPGSG